jgi:hypothetical protein
MLKAVTNLVNVSQITGVLPVVNGGTGVTTSTGTGNVVLSAAPTLSGDVSLSTGNLVMSTSGKGIDFSATAGTGTSELLADYEEGTWTPIDGSGASLSLTNETTATYTKVGRIVTVQWAVKYPVTASTAQVAIGGLPFTIASGSYSGISISQSEYTTAITAGGGGGGTAFSAYTYGNSAVQNVSFSTLRLRGSFTYFV